MKAVLSIVVTTYFEMRKIGNIAKRSHRKTTQILPRTTIHEIPDTQYANRYTQYAKRYFLIRCKKRCEPSNTQPLSPLLCLSNMPYMGEDSFVKNNGLHNKKEEKGVEQ